MIGLVKMLLVIRFCLGEDAIIDEIILTCMDIVCCIFIMYVQNRVIRRKYLPNCTYNLNVSTNAYKTPCPHTLILAFYVFTCIWTDY